MKKKTLDIIILICLIIIIAMLIFMNFSIKDKANRKELQTPTESKVVSSNQKNKTEDYIDSENTLFTDTTKANNEEEVVFYISQVEEEISKLSLSDTTNSNLKDKFEDTFITLTDFIFYGGSIKGVTFAELTDEAKEKVLLLYEKIDSTIENKFPNYKENIKSTADKGYTTAVSKAISLKNTIIAKYKEKVGEEQYNNVVDSFTQDKNHLQDAYTPYVEKGMEIGSKVMEKGKEVVGNAIDGLDSWYQGFKESRE